MVFLGLDKTGCSSPCLKDPFCDSAVVDVAILTQNVQQIVENEFDLLELDIMDITCDLFKCIFYSKDGENFCLSSHPSVCTYDPIAGPNSCYPGYGHNDSQACHLNWYVSFSSCWRRLGDCTDARSNSQNFNLTESLLSVWEKCTVPRDCWDPCVRVEIEADLGRLCSLCDLDNCTPVCSRTWTDVLTSILGQSKNKKCGGDSNGFLYEIEHDCECQVYYYDHGDCRWKPYTIRSPINPDSDPEYIGCNQTSEDADSSEDADCQIQPLYRQRQWDFYHSVVEELINEKGGGSIEDPICVIRCFANCGPVGELDPQGESGDVMPENCAYSFYARCYRKRCKNEMDGLEATCIPCKSNIKCLVQQYTICCEHPCDTENCPMDDSASICETSNKYIVRATRLLCIDGPFKRVILRVGTLFKNPNAHCQDILVRMRYCVKIPQEEFMCICGYCPAGAPTAINDQCKKRLNLSACELINIKNCRLGGCVENFKSVRGCDLLKDNTLLDNLEGTI
jgi:hypothetical protein